MGDLVIIQPMTFEALVTLWPCWKWIPKSSLQLRPEAGVSEGVPHCKCWPERACVEAGTIPVSCRWG